VIDSCTRKAQPSLRGQNKANQWSLPPGREPLTVKPIQLAHVLYRTRRFSEMLEWYQAVFGATVQYQNEALAFLTFDDEHHRFGFADLEVIRPDGADKDARGAIGVDHVAWEYSSLTDLLNNFADLKAKGIEPYWCVNHGMSASLYYSDPDGNQMEFTVDCFPSKAEATAYFRGDAIGANPVGVEYDPETWLERLRAGAPEAELLAVDRRAEASPIRGALLEMPA
jgi:catechol 2,3-dioxygenase-like lactoylglutathione lyase family enzyme